mmetsp:Transcript_21768/g.24805  ORF Transcript_21768/g.24805 Transcript_21768/m.24805 type:complete len:414 (+) Transcript_21768:91-1332(+)
MAKMRNCYTAAVITCILLIFLQYWHFFRSSTKIFSVPSVADVTSVANVTSLADKKTIYDERLSIFLNENDLSMANISSTIDFSENSTFSQSKELAFNRMNLITTISGCRISRWIYAPIPTNIEMRKFWRKKKFDRMKPKMQWRYKDCIMQPKTKYLGNNSKNMLNPMDTIYVPIYHVLDFIHDFLDHIKTPVVVISGGLWSMEVFSVNMTKRLLQNEFVSAWFLTNLKQHIQNDERILHHPKLRSWPYGLKEYPWGYLDQKHYIHALRQSWNITIKSQGLYKVHFRVGNNPKSRSFIPNGRLEGIADYYRKMSKAYYIFSPDGDRPDTYRHYEAIGLGVIPITQLDPLFYRHFGTSVVYNNSNWNVSYWNTIKHRSAVNRNMVFQEYWIEYAEREVGSSLQWWDNKYLQQSLI